jgi:excisionase family DNA binding protein
MMPHVSLPQPVAIPVKEAARLLSCSRTHVYDLIRRGELLRLKDGRMTRVLTASIEAYLDRNVKAPRWPAG